MIFKFCWICLPSDSSSSFPHSKLHLPLGACPALPASCGQGGWPRPRRLGRACDQTLASSIFHQLSQSLAQGWTRGLRQANEMLFLLGFFSGQDENLQLLETKPTTLVERTHLRMKPSPGGRLSKGVRSWGPHWAPRSSWAWSPTSLGFSVTQTSKFPLHAEPVWIELCQLWGKFWNNTVGEDGGHAAFCFASILNQLPLMPKVSSPHFLQEAPQDLLISDDLCLPRTQSP